MKKLLVTLLAAVLVCMLVYACGGSSDSVSIPVGFVNGQSASVVIGQADFYNGTINRGGIANEYTMNQPWGTPAVANGVLYIPDSANHRVLGYNSIPSVNNAPADFVLGQPDFTNTTGGVSRSKLSRPTSIVSDNGMFFLGEANNHRVLVYNSPPTTTGALPDMVLGQPDFNSNSYSCSSTSLGSVYGLSAAGGRLIVAVYNQDRVLIWNSTSGLTNGAAADMVLGQKDTSTCTSQPPSDSTFNSPHNVWSDGNMLAVMDNSNNRVLIWKTFPTINNTPADVVVGQADFANTVSDVSPYNISDAYFLGSNGTQLFVSDYGGNRVMIWNRIPAVNNAPADIVLGQPDLATGTGDTTADKMNGPGGVLPFGNKLIVGEYNNSRVLIFQGQ